MRRELVRLPYRLTEAAPVTQISSSVTLVDNEPYCMAVHVFDFFQVLEIRVTDHLLQITFTHDHDIRSRFLAVMTGYYFNEFRDEPLMKILDSMFFKS